MTDSCVLLDEQGEDVLLLWPADRTTWHPDERTVSFQNTDGDEVTLGDGDQVSFGGGGSSVREGGVASDEFMESAEWVAAPDASCVAEIRWSVGDVVELNNSKV